MLNAIRYLVLPVLNSLGPVFMWLSLAMCVPLVTSLAKTDGAHRGFIVCITVSALIGALLTFGLARWRRELSARHGFLLVTLTWGLVPLLSVIPLHYALPDVGLAALYFETMSCLTTTGGTVLTGLDQLPLSINGLRCLLSWVGGMGLIVLSVAILPLLGVGGAQIIKAEVSGPLKETKLTPRIADTAKALYIIYLGISVACTIAYHLAGMSWDDAVLHMMTTVSLSGISAHDASFAFFNSANIDWVATAFMALCGFNFALHFGAWHQRNPFIYFFDVEARAWLIFLLVTILVVAGVLWAKGLYTDPLTALRHAAFAVTSTASTSGFTSANWEIWPFGIPVLLILSSCFATSGGSTGGGLKMIRLLILFKLIRRELMQLLYPKASLPIMLNGGAVSQPLLLAVVGFILAWIVSAVFIALLLLLSGMGATEAFSASISCLSNLGPGLGEVGPTGNYAGLNTFQYWLCAFAMLIGRLEIFTVFVLTTRAFWRT